MGNEESNRRMSGENLRRIIATVVATALSPATWRVFRQQRVVRR